MTSVETPKGLSAAERQRVLFDWNRTATEYPRRACIHEVFEQEAARRPDAIALKFRDRQMTYGELNRRANQLAHYLRELGVGPEMMVGMLLERSFEIVIALMAVLKADGAYVPLDPSYPAARLGFMRADTKIPVMLTQQALNNPVPGGSKAVVVPLDGDCPEIDRQSADNLDHRSIAENLAYVMYTSGSTGRPKGVMVPHRAVVRLVKNTNYAELTDQETFLQFSPVSFDASTLEIWGPLLNGGCLAIMPPGEQSLAELGAAIRTYGVTSMWLTAGLFNVMVEQRLEDLRPLRQLLIGGDVLSPAHVAKALAELPACKMINGYGPTEGTTFSCCHPIQDDDGRAASIPIGRPLSNTQVYLLNAMQEPVGIGEVGELCIGGDGLARGYLNQPELTAEKFVPHPFSDEPGARIYKSGDLARYRADGTIEFLGRADNQVKVRGHRIELGEIESVLMQHDGVQSCVVSAQANGAGEKKLVAYVVASIRNLGDSGLRSFLEEKLPAYMLPSAFVFLPALPLTPNGKVDQAALPAPEMSPVPVSLSPQSEMEQIIATVWKRVLGLKQVGVEENFFDLGGDSLQLLDAHAELQRSVGIDLSITDLFEHSTIRGLAQRMAGEESQSRLLNAQKRASRQQSVWMQFGPAKARRSQ